jgi:hypothetical protein
MATKRPLVNYSGTIKELQVGDDITGATGGDVVGPSSSTDNAIVRYDGTTGKLIQNSGVIIDDSNNVSGVVTLTTTNLIVNDDTTLGGSNADTVTVNGRITTDLEPATNNAKDIGTNGRNWRDGFFGRNLNTVNLAVTGTTSFDGNQGSSGQVLTSAGSGNTPTWETPTSGGDVFKASTNTFTANQVIEVTDNTVAALRVTQLGNGAAIRVEDSSNPDSTPFIVTGDGRVGIGTASPSNALDVVASEPIIKISTSSSGLSTFYQATNPQGTFYAGKDRDGSSGLYGSSGEYVIAGSGNYPMDFWVNNSKAFTINANGNINVPGTGKRITGDMTNATIANRLMFQTNTTNGNTLVSAIPNGTSIYSAFQAYNNPDPTNAGYISLGTSDSLASIAVPKRGTGTYLPLNFETSDVERLRITVNGGISVGATGTNYGTTGQVLTSQGDAPPTWTTVSGGGGGAVADGCIYENNLTITSNYTLTTNKNGFSVGPITIASGAVVTVPSGQRWVVL